MNVTLSIPAHLVESAESLGKRLGVARNRLYAAALAEFLAKHQDGAITERLNRLYGEDDSRLEEPLRRRQARTMGDDSW